MIKKRGGSRGARKSSGRRPTVPGRRPVEAAAAERMSVQEEKAEAAIDRGQGGQARHVRIRDAIDSIYHHATETRYFERSGVPRADVISEVMDEEVSPEEIKTVWQRYFVVDGLELPDR